MIRIFVLVLATLAGVQLLSQTFRPGYLITPAGNRKEIELDDRDWADNPKRFRYREADGEIRHGDVNTVAEFGLADGSVRYQSLVVAIDSSGDHLADLSRSATLRWGDRHVFLELLVDGEADLFYWEEGERKRFFYRRGNADAVQLVDRRYLQNDRIVVQHHYLGQVKSALSCSTTDGQVYDLEFNKDDLVSFFEQFNACFGTGYTLHLRPEQERSLFLWGKVGASRYTGAVLSYTHSSNPYERRLLPNYALSAALELEYSVPRAGGRWSMLAGAGYQHVRSESMSPEAGQASLDWRGICAPVGVRRYFGLSSRTSAFMSVLVIGQVTLDGSANILRTFISPTELNPHWTYQLAAAAGIRHRRLSVEFRYGRQLDILRLYDYFASRFNEISFSLGYRVW